MARAMMTLLVSPFEGGSRELTTLHSAHLQDFLKVGALKLSTISMASRVMERESIDHEIDILENEK